jgi:hypothetical protein
MGGFDTWAVEARERERERNRKWTGISNNILESNDVNGGE